MRSAGLLEVKMAVHMIKFLLRDVVEEQAAPYLNLLHLLLLPSSTQMDKKKILQRCIEEMSIGELCKINSICLTVTDLLCMLYIMLLCQIVF